MKCLNKLLSLLLALVMLVGMACFAMAGPVALAEGEPEEPAAQPEDQPAGEPGEDPTTEIASVGLSLTLPGEGSSAAAAVSVSSGEGVTVQEASWLDENESVPGSLEAGKSYHAVIVLAAAEGFVFTEATAVSIDSLGVAGKSLESGKLQVTTVPYTIPVPVDNVYPVWLGNTQVTDKNRNNILGDGTASYDPDTKTLTLNNTTIAVPNDSNGALIRADNTDLVVTGTATLEAEGAKMGINISGSGKLTLENAELTITAEDTGIRTDDGDLLITGSTVKVNCEKDDAIHAEGSITISGEKTAVTAKTKEGEHGVYAKNKIAVDAGSLEGQSKGYGIYAGTGITMADTHGVVLPVNGELSESGQTVCDSGGATAKRAKIARKDATYTVAFDTYGGPEIDSQTVVSGGTAERPEDPELEGFNFEGWYLDPENDPEPYDFSAPVTEDLTLKAFWTTTVTVSVKDTEGNKGKGGTVSLGDGSYAATASDTIWRDSPAPFWVGCKNATGYTFDHWEDGQGNTLSETGKSFNFSAKDGPREFVAVFRRTSYIVTFHTGAGASAVPSQTVPYGGQATEPEPEPTRTGYVFDCWCADKSCKIVYDFSTPVTADITLYAKWNQKAKYTVVSGGGAIYARASGKELQLIVKRNPNDAACFEHFTGVKIDGGELKLGVDYTAEDGESTIITLKPSYLGKLTSGRHIITIVFDDGEATTGMIVKAGKSGGRQGGKSGTESPDTGDPGSPLLWAGMLGLACVGLGGVILTGRRARRAGR